jgi:hypothetical protein
VIRRCAAFVNAHISFRYAALSKTPLALADGLMLVFKHPVKVFLTFFGRRLQGGAQKKEPHSDYLVFSI